MRCADPAEDPLYRDAALAQFYDLDNQWGPDQDYCLALAAGARTVLDLGCGTGQLAARLAEAREVVGVDPAAAMLEIGRQRPGGDRVEWILEDARDLKLERRFDLVLLTGHAFQVFLSDSDQSAALAAIARHLAPGGRFIFDTRNPACEAWREWTPGLSRRSLEHPALGAVEAWNDAVHDAATGIVTYETRYKVRSSGQCYSAVSQIRFTPREALAVMLEEAGLRPGKWLGDWTGGRWAPNSPEIIPVGGRHPQEMPGQAPIASTGGRF